MHEENTIIRLIERFLSNEASSDEKKKLFQMLNAEAQKDQLFLWLEETWEKTDHHGLEIPSKEMLEKIHGQILPSVADTSEDKKRKHRSRSLLRTSLKYAAVVLVACIIEWVILTNMQQPPNEVLQALNYHEVTVPKGSKSFLVLADSTKVWLNAGARLRYPVNFQQSSRKVFLEGEAFFDVTENKDVPFFVSLSGMDIKVLGTRFNVKAYTDENNIEATLLEGAIEVVGLPSDKQEGNLRLSPGQKLILTTEQATRGSGAVPSKIKNAEIINLSDPETETAWIKDKLIFHKERFDRVKVKLERWYGVTIDIQDADILDYRFTGTFDEETFEQALQALQKAARFEYEITKKHVIIKRN